MNNKKWYGILLATLPLMAQAQNQQWDFDFSAGIEYGYDDNVIVDEIDLASSNGDHFFRLNGAADIEFKPNQASEFSAGISISDLQYDDNDQFDLRTVLVNTGYQHELSGYTLALDLRYADAELGGNGFLSLTQVSPSISAFLSREHFVRGAYTFIDKDLDSTNLRDAETNEFSLDYYYFRQGLTQYFIVSGKLRYDDAEDDQFDYWSYQIRAAYKQRYILLNQENQLTLDIRYRDRDYDEAVNTTINDFRRDKRTSFSVDNSWSVNDNLDVILKYEYIENDSNLASFNFDENVYSLAVTYHF